MVGRFALVGSVMFALVGIVGCGGAEELPTYPVTGKVSFSGMPVAEGEIVFEDATGLPPDAGKIANGEFSLRAKAGRKVVRIRASREVPGEQNAGIPGTPVRRDYIPAKYNTKSTLVEEVKADAPNEFSFELKET